MFDFIIGFLSVSVVFAWNVAVVIVVSCGCLLAYALLAVSLRVGGYYDPKWIYDKIIDKYRTDNTRLRI